MCDSTCQMLCTCQLLRGDFNERCHRIDFLFTLGKRAQEIHPKDRKPVGPKERQVCAAVHLLTDVEWPSQVRRLKREPERKSTMLRTWKERTYLAVCASAVAAAL